MPSIPPPPDTRREPVSDHLHGHTIVDPYRWLEDADSPETREWVAAQNAYTQSVLTDVPGRERIRSRLAELLSIGLVTAPAVRRGRYFYLRREGEQNQPVLYLRDDIQGAERVLLDPNAESAEGLTVLDWWYPSPDGRLLAYGYSENGNEWSTLHILDINTGDLLPDRIPRTRYASLAWLPDASGFYYTRYPTPGDVPAQEENYNQRLYLHLIGSDPADDPEVVITEMEREDHIAVTISQDGRYLAAMIAKGWERSNLFLRDLTDDGAPFVPVAVGYDALFEAAFAGDTLYIHTNLDAPRYRLFAASVENPAREHWQEIIPEGDAVLQSVQLAGGKLIAGYLENATSSLAIHEPDGSLLHRVELPGMGTVDAITGRWEDLDAFYSFVSFTRPNTVYRLDLSTGASAEWLTSESHVRPDDYEVRQEWYMSRDGTRVSMFIVHRKDLDRSRPRPLYLTGYGGFNISRTPAFLQSAYLWLERGGIYALPNLRGGGEYGEAWHRAGMLDRKQNVFDDFIAAAEYLIAEGYTDTDHLAIGGGSNGGLLVGAALTQRPELYRAVVCAVPLLDMLRYHQFLIARLWIPEYGSAENAEHFPFLHGYSPYHHVREGVCYPATLLTTAESDTRVDPLHARKMAALLQASTGCDRPILLRVETQAGHGVGKPLTKIVDEQTDQWSFLFWQLGLEA